MITRRCGVVAVAAVWAVLGLAGCGGEQPAEQPGSQASESPGEGDQGETRVSEESPVPTSDPGSDPEHDVEITSCDGSPPGGVGVHADLKITNSTSEAWGYSGSVEFVGPDGKVITEGLFAENRIGPGETVPALGIPGNTFESHPEVECRLAGVFRNPPK